jgi:hypothetical protein
VSAAWTFGQRVQRDLIRIQLRQLEHKVQRQRAAGDAQGADVTTGRRRSPLSGSREW